VGLTTNDGMRLERVLAAVRVCVACASLLAYWLLPVGAISTRTVALWVMAGYAAYSVAVFAIALRGEADLPALSVHGFEWGWVAAILFLAPGDAQVPFAGILAFIVLAGVLRWRDERARRIEASTIARLFAQVQPELGTTGSLESVFRELLQVFRARKALLVAADAQCGRLCLWEMTEGAEPAVRSSELDLDAQTTYLFPAPAQCWYAERDSDGADGLNFRVTALDTEGKPLPPRAFALPPPFLGAQPFDTMLAVSLPFHGEGTDRLMLFDSARGRRALSFLQRLVQQIGPALYGLFLLGRLRARVAAAERERVARELHDGVIQALVGLEMKLEAWRRQDEAGGPAALKLEYVQRQVHEQVLSLRELMQQLRPVGLHPGQLVPYLGALVERFRRETGIDARFSATVEPTALPPTVCRELARIVQEALVNVRRHSGARHTLVTLDQLNGSYSLRIDDDGRGFGFSGHVSQDDLDRNRRGPVVIKERVRAIDATLSIDSDPGRGATLEIRIPRPGYE
jgi:signal transduction histidine kinase